MEIALVNAKQEQEMEKDNNVGRKIVNFYVALLHRATLTFHHLLIKMFCKRKKIKNAK